MALIPLLTTEIHKATQTLFQTAIEKSNFKRLVKNLRAIALWFCFHY